MKNINWIYYSLVMVSVIASQAGTWFSPQPGSLTRFPVDHNGQLTNLTGAPDLSMLFLIEGSEDIQVNVLLPLIVPRFYKVSEVNLLQKTSPEANGSNLNNGVEFLIKQGYNVEPFGNGNMTIVWTISILDQLSAEANHSTNDFLDTLAAHYSIPFPGNSQVLTRATFCHKVSGGGYCTQYSDIYSDSNNDSQLEITEFTTCASQACVSNVHRHANRALSASRQIHSTGAQLFKRGLKQMFLAEDAPDDVDQSFTDPPTEDTQEANKNDCDIITWKKLFFHSFYGMPATFCTWEQAQALKKEEA